MAVTDYEQKNEKIIEKDTDFNKVSNFRIPHRIVSNLKEQSITRLFDIQAKSFDMIYEGSDFIGRARTGQGKTLAFVLPIASKMISERKKNKTNFPRVANSPSVIVLCPVRELAAQVTKVFSQTCGKEISVCSLFGGTAYGPQIADLRRGVDVVVGTCGRVKDLIEKQSLRLENIRYVVLDEVDEMLNIGFADDVEKILSEISPEREHQVLLFSATLPAWVFKIARKYLDKDFKQIDLIGETQLQTSQTIKHYAICSHFNERDAVLESFIDLHLADNESAIIFMERKVECNDLAQGALAKHSCRVLHGDVPQKERSATIEAFRRGEFKLLIATDVAARGLSVPLVALVIQMDPPACHETYVHRSGRTGRAGKGGRSVLFYTPKKSDIVQMIERKAKIEFLRIGSPSLSEKIKKMIGKFQEMVQAVPASTRALLAPGLKEQLKDFSGEDCAIAAIVQLSGGKGKFVNRSVLCGLPGLFTVCVKGDRTTTKGSIYKVCDEALGKHVSAGIKHFTMFKDKTGAAFDLNERYMDKVTALSRSFDDDQGASLSFEITSELPALASFGVDNRTQYGGNGWGRTSSSSYGGQRDRTRRRQGYRGNNAGRYNGAYRANGGGRNNGRANGSGRSNRRERSPFNFSKKPSSY